MKENKTKKIIKSIILILIFFLIFIIIFNKIFSKLWISKGELYTIYNEPDNSLDIVYYGPSNARAHFNPLIAYDKYGYTTGMFTANTQPFDSIKYLIKETKKYQNPKLYIIDLSKLAYDMDTYTEADIRKTTDSLKDSLNRIELINELLSNRNFEKKEYIPYYFSFLLYHNRWKDYIKGQIGEGTNNYKGYSFSSFTTNIEEQTNYIWNEEKEKLPKINEEFLLELIDYIKEEDINVLFVVAKRGYEESINKRLNYSIEILEKNNFKVLNFNKIEFGVNPETDFYNRYHLNVYGATKYTLYFSKYLKDNYNLPDHRNDPKYTSWVTEYERFKTDFKRITSKDFNSLLKISKEKLENIYEDKF